MLPPDWSTARIKREPQQVVSDETTIGDDLASLNLKAVILPKIILPPVKREPSPDMHSSLSLSHGTETRKKSLEKLAKKKRSVAVSSPEGSRKLVAGTRPPRVITPAKKTLNKRKKPSDQTKTISTRIPRKKPKTSNIVATGIPKKSQTESRAQPAETKSILSTSTQAKKKESEYQRPPTSLIKFKKKKMLGACSKTDLKDDRECNSISLTHMTTLYSYAAKDGVDVALIHKLFRQLGFLSHRPVEQKMIMQAVDSNHVFAQKCIAGMFERLQQSTGKIHPLDSPEYYHGIWAESGYGKLCTEVLHKKRNTYALRIKKCVRIMLSEVQHDATQEAEFVTSLFLACLKTRKCRGTYKVLKPLFAMLAFDQHCHPKCPNPFLDQNGKPTGWSNIASSHLSKDGKACLQGKALCEVIKPAEEAFVALVVLKYLFGEVFGSSWPTQILRDDYLDLATWAEFNTPVVTPWFEERGSPIEFSNEDHRLFFQALELIAGRVKTEVLNKEKKKLSYRFQFHSLQDQEAKKMKAAKKAGKGIAILDFV